MDAPFREVVARNYHFGTPMSFGWGRPSHCFGAVSFVTTDERILKKKNELENICAARIVKPSEFLSLVQEYETSGG